MNLPLNDISKEVISCLNDATGNGTMSNLADLIETTEKELYEIAQSFLMAELNGEPPFISNYCENIVRKIDKSHYLRMGGAIYVPGRLDIFIGNVSKGNDSKILELCTKINQSGKYGQFNMRVVEGALTNPSKTIHIIAQIFKTGYTWMKEAVRRWVKETETEAESSLISVLRRNIEILNKPKIADKVWFVVTNGNNITYAIDSSNYLDFYKACEGKMYGEMSPIEVISHIFDEYIPFKQSFSREAWREKKPIEIDISKAKYRDEHTSIQLAQEAIYHPGMILHPIIRKRSLTLLAIYPTELRFEVENVLKLCEPELQRIVNDKARKFVKTWKNVKSRTEKLPYGNLGEFVGGFTKIMFDL